MKQLSTLFKNSLLSLALLAGFVGAALLVPDVVSASNVNQAQGGVNAIGGNEAGNGAGAFTKLLENIINILLFIIGAIAVIMIIIGGIRYTTSAGDQSAVTSAKNTILYSIVGLVIAIMSYALVNFVLRSLE